MQEEEQEFNQNVFFEFEEKYNLFSNESKGIFYWDLIRFELFYHLLWNHKSNVKNEQAVISKKQIFKEIKSFITFLFSKKVDFLFFTASRNKISNSKAFDQNLADILNAVPRRSYYAFESFERSKEKWFYENTLFNPISIFRRIAKIFYKKNEDYSELISLIKKEFSNSSFTNEDINRVIVDFKIDFFYYSIIFKIKKPKAIFITQNGIQKGLFQAGKKRNIPIIEMQHGIIDSAHLAYSYSRLIDYKQNQIYLPTYFFSFSDFWMKGLNFPIQKNISIGNSYFFNSQDNSQDLKEIENNATGLLVASSDVFGENLKNLAIDFASINKDIPVYFKLHPNQFFEKQYYIDQFKNFKNISVYSNESSVYELLEISKAILVIQSTALYEAYHLKKNAFIYKKQTYQRHEHVFDLPNINLINNAGEISEAFDKEFIEDENTENLFFKNFDSHKFNQFVNSLS
ncbi:hypothetical protein [Flavobacterium sp. ov086]|uniref:hypothetical protein n=1 Tax=Flavobacterium sp. ov086 TaxID=1761785 RepID=UPI000B75BA06|nr:hypothetical protein [Flavobacterium sp. ov086]SNR49506.1 hypothetical protein SAMN04487979_10868 [Flavobacterium sp. ov086]